VDETADGANETLQEFIETLQNAAASSGLVTSLVHNLTQAVSRVDYITRVFHLIAIVVAKAVIKVTLLELNRGSVKKITRLRISCWKTMTEKGYI